MLFKKLPLVILLIAMLTPLFALAQNIGPVAVPATTEKEAAPPKPLEEVYPILRSQIASRFSRDEQAKAEALRELKTYRGVEELIAAEIAEDAASGEFNTRIRSNFIVLARLRTLKALKIIGPYLYDDRILYAPSEDMAHEIPSACAGMAITNMNLANAPTPSVGWGVIPATYIDNWRVWWEENKNNLEAALNPPSEAQAQTPSPQAPGTGPNLRLRSEASSPEEEKAPSTPDAANLNVPALLLVVLGTLLAVVAAILLRRSRK